MTRHKKDKDWSKLQTAIFAFCFVAAIVLVALLFGALDRLSDTARIIEASESFCYNKGMTYLQPTWLDHDNIVCGVVSMNGQILNKTSYEVDMNRVLEAQNRRCGGED